MTDPHLDTVLAALDSALADLERSYETLTVARAMTQDGGQFTAPMIDVGNALTRVRDLKRTIEGMK